MELINAGINAYGPTSIAFSEENSLHPCYVDPCPYNLCGTCQKPVAVYMC